MPYGPFCLDDDNPTRKYLLSLGWGPPHPLGLCRSVHCGTCHLPLPSTPKPYIINPSPSPALYYKPLSLPQCIVQRLADNHTQQTTGKWEDFYFKVLSHSSFPLLSSVPPSQSTGSGRELQGWEHPRLHALWCRTPLNSHDFCSPGFKTHPTLSLGEKEEFEQRQRGKPDVLQFMRSQRVRHDLVTEPQQ